MQIEELIPGINIEDTQNEFKRIIEEGKSEDSGKSKEIGWLKTIAAFANTIGGTLYVGVDNNTHKIISLDHDSADKIILMINRQIKQRIEPAISYKIDTISIKDEEKQTRYIIKVVVNKNTILPVTLHEENLLGIYIRSYGSSILASPEQIRELILLSDNNPFDQPFTEDVFDKNNFKQIFELYKERTNSELTEKALISAGFINSDRKLSKGAQLFSDNYKNERTKIVCTVWPEITKGSSLILASEEFDGNLVDSIKFATQFIQNHSVNGFKKIDEGRIDYYSYPARSITEGIVNAVAHRNYFIQGSQIEINMFKDRLEITSPGALLGVVALQKEKNISSIIPRRRNEVICNILEYLRYMESKGSGFDKIEQDYAGKGEAFKPFISSNGNSFTLTLPNLTYPNGVIDENSIPEINVDGIVTGKNDKAILSFCFTKAHTAKEIAEYLGINASTYFRKDVLDVLVKNGFLIESNSGSSSAFLSNREKVFPV